MTMTSTQKQIAAWLLVGVVAVLLLWLLGPVLTPFLVAAVLAYALDPVVERTLAWSHNRLPRTVAVSLVVLLFMLLSASLLLLVVPVVVREVPLIRAQLPLMLDKFDAWAKPLLAQFDIKYAFDTATIKAKLLAYFNTNRGDLWDMMLPSLKSGGTAALAWAANMLLIPLVLFYFLLDWQRIVGAIKQAVPLRLRAGADSFMAEADSVLGQYMRGQILVMGVLAVYYSVGLSLFGLELALPIGIFTGLAVFVPYLGFGLGLVLASLAGLLQMGFNQTLLMVGVVYGAGQLLESFFLTPRLVGERIGLHPVAVIFALMAFGSVFGFVGVLVALPVSAVMLVALRRLETRYYQSAMYRGDVPAVVTADSIVSTVRVDEANRP